MNTNEAFAAYRAWHDTHAEELRRALVLYATASGWRVREYSDPGLRLQLQSDKNELVEVHALTAGGWLVNGVETDDLTMTLTAIAPHEESAP